jgi:hypothetical protein
LTIATQGIEQLSKDAASAVFTNCATVVSFRVSNTDAERLKDEFAMVVPASNLQDLADWKMYVRTLGRGTNGASSPSGPHLVQAYAPFSKVHGNADREQVVRVSRERYTKSRAVVDAKLTRFLMGERAAT